jgi:hypothetical protein
MATEMGTSYGTIHKVDVVFPAAAAKSPAFELGSIVEVQDFRNSAHWPFRVHFDLLEPWLLA